jgi:hypothetical protein
VISVEFAIENTNQKSMANDKSMIPAFNLAWRQFYSAKCRTINKLNTARNHNWWKWCAWSKTWHSNDFDTARNHSWANTRGEKDRGFNLDESRIPFRRKWVKLLDGVEQFHGENWNRYRNVRPHNESWLTSEYRNLD